MVATAHRNRSLLFENEQLILGVLQFRETDRIAPKHPGGHVRWVIARSKHDHIGAGNLSQQTFEIAVCQDQDEVVSSGVVQNPAISNASKPVSKGAFGFRQRSRRS